MSLEMLSIIKGKKIKVLKMELTNFEDRLEFKWDVMFDNICLNIIFYNTSRIKVNGMSIPLEIYGFDVIDHTSKGWDSSSRYEIYDFEDDYISFFCENISIRSV